MALYRRLSPGDNNDGQKESPEYPIAKQPKTKRTLLARHEVPSWCSHNQFLLTGFRPTAESVQRCVESLGYVHNETVNIYSHLVPAVITFTRAAFIHLYFRAHYPNILWVDQLAFYLHLGVSTLCLTISAIYHMSLSHSEFYADFWGRLDYVAILLQLVGSGMSGTHFGFYCEQALRRVYLPLVGSTPNTTKNVRALIMAGSQIGVPGLLSTIIVLYPRFQGVEWRLLRLAAFLATAIPVFIPLLYFPRVAPYGQITLQTGWLYYVIELGSLTTGMLFYAVNIDSACDDNVKLADCVVGPFSREVES